MAKTKKTQNCTNFSPKQIKQLRNGLRKYRKKHDYSWMQVTYELISSESNDYSRPIIALKKGDKEDKYWPIKEKMISRFAGKEERKIRDYKISHAIRAFLIENGIWKPRYDDAKEMRFNEAIELSEYFLNPESTYPSLMTIDLTGNFEIIEENICSNFERSLSLELFEEAHFYEVEERLTIPTEGKPRKVHKQGWANITSFNKILVFLEDQVNKRQELYVGQSLKFFKDGSIEIQLAPLTSMAVSDKTGNIIPLKSFKERRSSEPIIYFKEFVEEQEDLTLRGLPAIDWAEFIVEAEEDKEMAKENLPGQYLMGCVKGDLEAVREAVKKGVKINCRTKGTNEHALHIAAGERHRHVVQYLATLKGINFLAKDYEGELPSTVATVRGDDPELGDFLTDLEMQQAQSQNRDYFDVFMNREKPNSEDPELSIVK